MTWTKTVRRVQGLQNKVRRAQVYYTLLVSGKDLDLL